jgi:hypothetical protein
MTMNQWPYEISKLTRKEVLEFTVNPKWQYFRKNLKGLSTKSKLILLLRWLQFDDHCDTTNGKPLREYQVQVDNYLNALKRGGQLNNQLEVVEQ